MILFISVSDQTNHFHETDAGGPSPSRHVELDIDIGADAKDWSAIQAGEKLQPVETELRRIEEMVAEVVAELDYLRVREQKLRDTNESTNERVKWFAFGTMGMLVGLGAWQIVYLRAYFRFVIASHLTVLASLHISTDPSTLSRRDGQYNAFHVISGWRAAATLHAAMVHRYCISNYSLSPPFACLPSLVLLSGQYMKQEQTRPFSWPISTHESL